MFIVARVGLADIGRNRTSPARVGGPSPKRATIIQQASWQLDRIKLESDRTCIN
jgi:hypothetical protein